MWWFKRKIDFDELLKQMRKVDKLIKSMFLREPRFPGLPPYPLGTFTYGQTPRIPDISGRHFRDVRAMIDSMTPEERSLKAPLSESRRIRIARGSGTLPGQVDALDRQMHSMRNPSHNRNTR